MRSAPIPISRTSTTVPARRGGVQAAGARFMPIAGHERPPSRVAAHAAEPISATSAPASSATYGNLLRIALTAPHRARAGRRSPCVSPDRSHRVRGAGRACPEPSSRPPPHRHRRSHRGRHRTAGRSRTRPARSAAAKTTSITIHPPPPPPVPYPFIIESASYRYSRRYDPHIKQRTARRSRNDQARSSHASTRPTGRSCSRPVAAGQMSRACPRSALADCAAVARPSLQRGDCAQRTAAAVGDREEPEAQCDGNADRAEGRRVGVDEVRRSRRSARCRARRRSHAAAGRCATRTSDDPGPSTCHLPRPLGRCRHGRSAVDHPKPGRGAGGMSGLWGRPARGVGSLYAGGATSFGASG